MFDRITFDSNIMGGRACIRGMRIPVSVIVGQIAHGATWEEVLDGYRGRTFDAATIAELRTALAQHGLEGALGDYLMQPDAGEHH